MVSGCRTGTSSYIGCVSRYDNPTPQPTSSPSHAGTKNWVCFPVFYSKDLVSILSFVIDPFCYKKTVFKHFF
jgi:hypothetical protein